MTLRKYKTPTLVQARLSGPRGKPGYTALAVIDVTYRCVAVSGWPGVTWELCTKSLVGKVAHIAMNHQHQISL